MLNICGLNTHKNLAEALKPILTFPMIRPSDATTLIKSAVSIKMLFGPQSDTSLAWIMQAAVETAANHWWKRKCCLLRNHEGRKSRFDEILAETGIEKKVAGKRIQ